MPITMMEHLEEMLNRTNIHTIFSKLRSLPGAFMLRFGAEMNHRDEMQLYLLWEVQKITQHSLLSNAMLKDVLMQLHGFIGNCCYHQSK
jgi:hypothetical protein